MAETIFYIAGTIFFTLGSAALLLFIFVGFEYGRL